jgi:ubiquinone/menaquinone biosynthesis C-methylase UbiE
MVLRKRAQKREKERMSDRSFKAMTFVFRVIDFIYPYIDKRVKKFGIKPGMTVADYGCGPGRYTTRFAEIVGAQGKVFAIDIHELAVEAVKKQTDAYGLKNVTAVLANGYESTLPDEIADVVCAIDMFHVIKDPTEFLAELKRITKKDGSLIVDDGHQSRRATKSSVLESGHWDIFEETRDHLKCKPRFS